VQKPRQIAARILQRRETGGEFIEHLLDEELAGNALTGPDRALCAELVCGCVRWQRTLDHLISLKTGGREQKPVLQNLLCLGLYQIFWLDRIPDHAAVNETVELAKKSGFERQAGFVNAILRGYLREADTTRALLAELKKTRPALGWSHPDWLVERWQKQFGPEHTAQLLEWNNTPPRTFARVNTLKTDVDSLLEKWRAENVAFDSVSRDWFGENLVFELKSPPPLASLASFRDGWFYLQDPSTLLAARELAPEPGQTVLDLCAAPGGKTTFIAQLMRDEGRIVACDVSGDRLNLIRENCARLGIKSVEASLALVLNFQPASFDRILIDAPCSNTGVMRRRVDLRWRVTAEEIARLQGTQLDLLRRAAPLLKPGGVLVHSTCSLEPEENGDVVRAFLREHADFRLESERQLTPFADNVDGAFVARLMRMS
jgi:16S rRNA (cytosine967-C5)-methyltransferase